MKSKIMALIGIVLITLAINLWAEQDQKAPAPPQKAQQVQPGDPFGITDTVYLEPYQINDRNWGVHVSMYNDEEIVALSIPLTFSAGQNRLVADSTVFIGGRAESFRVKHARPDTSTQCVTIGLIADIGISVPPIPAGKGKIATIFISSLDKKDISGFTVDTTTTPPGNDLLLVTPNSDGIKPAVIIKGAGKSAPKEVKKEGQ
jgi:hypothetical protein